MLDNLARKLTGIFAGLRREGHLSEEDVTAMLREVRVALLDADVNFAVAKRFVASVKEKAIGENIYGSLTADQTIIRIVRDELTAMLGGEPVNFRWSSAPPTVILMCGLQGSGKTTTTAKLAKWLIDQGKKPMLAACDIQRPAAIKQLEVLGEALNVPVFSKTDGTKPPQIAKDALERCKHLLLDVLIVDTAGRLQIDEGLMGELKQIHDSVKPSESFLVVDSTTGQEAVNVAQAFHEQIPITGAIFTKMDGDTRGGALLSVRETTGVTVRFIGVGEQTAALDMFHPDRMAQRILGMGDVMGIIEKAEQAVADEDAQGLEGKLKRGTFDFEDMLAMFSTMRKMGPIQNLFKMIPGIATHVPQEQLDGIDDKGVNRIEAIILSMTPFERSSPDSINGSRRKRIAKGSGRTVEEVNALIKQLYEMRRNMKQFNVMQSRMSKFQKRRR
jgi:signal recognition particle subunit SRP54